MLKIPKKIFFNFLKTDFFVLTNQSEMYAEDESIPHKAAKYSFQVIIWVLILIAELVYMGVTLSTFISQQNNLVTRTEIGNLNSLPGKELKFPRVLVCPIYLAEKLSTSLLTFSSCKSFPAGRKKKKFF